MAVIVPTIPEYITVHLGIPSEDAPNVTVPFIDYVKNVASGEIYPTWELSALRANILAIVSFALNRVYLEYYPSRDYPFDITSTTAYDQSFVPGRSTFRRIDLLVEELYDDYIRRQGFIEPLAAKFCNGTTVTCDGMSQWGSQALAQQGKNSIEILKAYYGDNIEIVTNARVESPQPSYPGRPLELGSLGEPVVRLQFILNRISQNYPAIPRISPIDGIFGEKTLQSVKAFQNIFALEPDGIVGRATWNTLTRIFVAVNRLSELQSEGQRLSILAWEFPEVLQEGDTGTQIEELQLMLATLGEFVQELPMLERNGRFDAATKQAVLAFQRWAGLNRTGLVGAVTWNRLFAEYEAVMDALQQTGQEVMSQFPGYDLSLGSRDGEVGA